MKLSGILKIGLMLVGFSCANSVADNGSATLTQIELKTCVSISKCLSIQSEKAYGTHASQLFVFMKPHFVFSNDMKKISGTATRAVIDFNVGQVTLTERKGNQLIETVYRIDTLDSTLFEVTL